jgi:hypothetical protein
MLISPLAPLPNASTPRETSPPPKVGRKAGKPPTNPYPNPEGKLPEGRAAREGEERNGMKRPNRVHNHHHQLILSLPPLGRRQYMGKVRIVRCQQFKENGSLAQWSARSASNPYPNGWPPQPHAIAAGGGGRGHRPDQPVKTPKGSRFESWASQQFFGSFSNSFHALSRPRKTVYGKGPHRRMSTSKQQGTARWRNGQRVRLPTLALPWVFAAAPEGGRRSRPA